MSSKKDWKKLKVTFLIIDIVLLVLVVAIGAFCGYRLYGISQLKNNGYTDSMAKLDQEEQRIRDDMLKRQPEVAAAVAEAEAALAQAELDLAGSQDALKVVTDQRDAVNGDIQEVQAKIDSIGSMEQQIADLRTEYGQACRQLEDMILAGESKYRICYLTFDDGPSYMTENFLKELDRLDVYATFFTIGVGVQPNSYGLRDKMLKEEAKGGHTIANHTYTHAFNSGLYSSVDSFMDSVNKQDQLVYEVTGIHTDIVRFPAGSYYCRYRTASIEALTEEGYGWIDWLGNAFDSGGNNYSAAYTASTVIMQARQEKIYVVLMHDWVNNTLRSLDNIVKTLRKENYVFLPLFKESSTIGNVYPRWDKFD